MSRMTKSSILSILDVYIKASDSLVSGKQKIYMKIYDKVGTGSVSVSKAFVLQ